MWLGVETSDPIYATSIVGQAGGGFATTTPGPGSRVLNTYNWVVATLDPNMPEYMPPGLPGIAAGTKVNNSDLLQFNANLNAFEIIRGGNLTQNFADQRYWQLNAGNMAWRDQPYNKGAVVYGLRFNAWFAAQQNITLGSAEPGTTAAGAIWRKINSTYGSTIFFGKGDYDTAAGHQDAAHNWGMPVGTYPAGQQPLNGDSYYDVTTGTEVQFAVSQNAPIFTISGDITVAGNQVGAALGPGDLDNWPNTRTLLTLPSYYRATLAAPSTPASGAFAGVAFTAGDWIIGYSGDPDASNGGWFKVPYPTGASAHWSIATPHPQAVPDTITPTVVWGTSRRYSITFDAGSTANTFRTILKNIPDTTLSYEVGIRDRDPNGSVYVLEFTTSQGASPRIGAVTIKSANPHFIEFGATTGVLTAKVGTGLAGKTYDVYVKSNIGTVDPVQVGNGTEGADYGTAASKQKADGDYPNDDLERLFKAAAGDPQASSPLADKKVGDNMNGWTLDFQTGRTYIYEGVWKVGTADGPAFVRLLKSNAAGGGDFVPRNAIIGSHGLQWEASTGGTGLVKHFDVVAESIAWNGSAWDGFALSQSGFVKKDIWNQFKIFVDKRDPTLDYMTFDGVFTTAGGQEGKVSWSIYIDKTIFPLQAFYFSESSGKPVTWKVFKS
jgi:hypothetical protein